MPVVDKGGCCGEAGRQAGRPHPSRAGARPASGMPPRQDAAGAVPAADLAPRPAAASSSHPCRSKAAEGAFLDLYQRLYEAPDPAPALSAGLELASRATHLEAEATKMAQVNRELLRRLPAGWGLEPPQGVGARCGAAALLIMLLPCHQHASTASPAPISWRNARAAAERVCVCACRSWQSTSRKARS